MCPRLPQYAINRFRHLSVRRVGQTVTTTGTRSAASGKLFLLRYGAAQPDDTIVNYIRLNRIISQQE